MPVESVLIVDDEEAVCWSLGRAFEREGYRVATAASAEEGLRLARQQRPDAVMLDVRLPGQDGLSALAELRRITRDAPVIVMTAFGDLATAVRAVAGGAFDYIAKPFDLDQALEAVARAVKSRPLAPSVPLPETSNDEIVGRSPAMQAVFKRIALVAPHDSPVLITGESGTGKELVARALHRHGLRRDRPLLPVHVAALNPNLVESELFGHVKGAFTGAVGDRPGLLSLADGGTIFLDELADIPLAVQAKLLRVLEHQEVLPVGSIRPQRIHVRILAATHQDLTAAVAAGTFRHDLYYRLNAFSIRLPAFSERIDDLPVLAEHFLSRFGVPISRLPAKTIAFLQARPWPGNVREFRNALEHATIFARGGELLPEHFPPPISFTAAPAAGSDRIADFVRRWVSEQIERSAIEPEGLHEALMNEIEPPLVEAVLERTGGNRVVAARWLGVARGTLRKLLNRSAGE